MNTNTKKRAPHVSYASVLVTFRDKRSMVMPEKMLAFLQYIGDNPDLSVAKLTEYPDLNVGTSVKALEIMRKNGLIASVPSKTKVRHRNYRVLAHPDTTTHVERLAARHADRDISKGMAGYYRLLSFAGLVPKLVSPITLKLLETIRDFPGKTDEAYAELLGYTHDRTIKILIARLFEQGVTTVRHESGQYINYLTHPFLIIDSIPVLNFSCSHYERRKGGYFEKAGK